MRSILTLALLFSGSLPWSMGSATAGSVQRYPRYGPIPTNCPSSVPIQHLRGGINHAFGRAPLWISPYFVTNQGKIHLGTGPNAQYEKAIWQIGPKLNEIVTIRGWNLSTGKAVMFGHSPHTSHPIRHIDPRGSASVRATNPGRFLFAGGYLFFPSSGCYVLVALWKNGAELYPFAVGR